MSGEVLVALLVSVVLGDEVKVFAADDDGAVHLGGNDGSGQDTATDGDLAGEGALLVCRGEKTVNLRISQPYFLMRRRISSSCRAQRFRLRWILLGSNCVRCCWRQSNLNLVSEGGS